jgi:predicted DNA-binding protein
VKRTTVWLTSSQCERLAKLSQKTGMKAAELIRRALDDFLKEKKIPQK